MFLTEYDQEKVLEQARREERREVTREVKREVEYRVATDMLRDGEPVEKIVKYSKLAEEAIRKIADGLGIAVI